MGSFGTPSREAENGFVGDLLCFIGSVGTKHKFHVAIMRPGHLRY
jgi:hypothetical protein